MSQLHEHVHCTFVAPLSELIAAELAFVICTVFKLICKFVE